MQTLFAFLIRLVLLAAGLLFAASLLLAAVVLAVAWGLGSAWARLTGRPVTPFVMRVDPRTGFARMHRRPAEPAPERAKKRTLGDVTDVEAKPPAAGG